MTCNLRHPTGLRHPVPMMSIYDIALSTMSIYDTTYLSTFNDRTYLSTFNDRTPLSTFNDRTYLSTFNGFISLRCLPSIGSLSPYLWCPSATSPHRRCLSTIGPIYLPTIDLLIYDVYVRSIYLSIYDVYSRNPSTRCTYNIHLSTMDLFMGWLWLVG